jgi:hypothetical protein
MESHPLLHMVGEILKELRKVNESLTKLLPSESPPSYCMWCGAKAGEDQHHKDCPHYPM